MDPCPAFDANLLTQTAQQLQAAFAHLRPGHRVISICTASFLLAATGLLDGRRATTHYLHVVRRDHGSEVANRAARSCVVPPGREGGQAQYVERPVPLSTEASTAATRAWRHINRDNALRLFPRLATRLGADHGG